MTGAATLRRWVSGLEPPLRRAATRLAGWPHLPALGGFVALTALLTYPLLFRMASTVHDYGDPLLNAWILAWNTTSLAHGNFAGYFDANIFFPAPTTLAYSEFLIPQTLLAGPIFLATGNAILAYNVVQFAAFVTTAFGMYLLAAHLAGRLPGFAAGVIFAFSPFMFDHLSHLQILSAGGLPLALLYLHRYFATGRTAHVVLFSVFYSLQALANAYYAIYLTFFAGLFILYEVIVHRRFLDGRFWRHMLLHAGIALAALGPFYYRYLELRVALGFIREPVNRSTLLSFFATSPLNRLYGDLTAANYTPESALFPGICALLLAVTGFFAFSNPWHPWHHRGPRWVTPLFRTVGWALLISGLLVGTILLTGGVRWTVLSMRLQSTELDRPVILFVLLLAARVYLTRRFGIERARGAVRREAAIYAGMLALAVAVTIPGALSQALYRLPGFDGLRAVPRMHVMTMLALAVLAAYGIKYVLSRLEGRARPAVACLLTAIVVIEFYSVPFPARSVPIGSDVPAVYAWLADQPEDFAIVEYPIRPWAQFWGMYFSIHHWKRLVTGFSGYPSPAYLELRSRAENVPSPFTLTDFEQMGIRYLVVHDRPEDDLAPESITAAIAALGDRVREAARFPSFDVRTAPEVGPYYVQDGGTCTVYELTRSRWQQPRLVRQWPSRARVDAVGADRSTWQLDTNAHPEIAHLAVDEDLTTRWHTDRQQPGDYFQIDLGALQRIDGVVLEVGTHKLDYPRGYRVDVSSDGTTWAVVAENPSNRPSLAEVLRPRTQKVEIGFAETVARHVRIVQTGSDDIYYWSINDLVVTGPGAGGPAR